MRIKFSTTRQKGFNDICKPNMYLSGPQTVCHGTLNQLYVEDVTQFMCNATQFMLSDTLVVKIFRCVTQHTITHLYVAQHTTTHLKVAQHMTTHLCLTQHTSHLCRTAYDDTLKCHATHDALVCRATYGNTLFLHYVFKCVAAQNV